MSVVRSVALVAFTIAGLQGTANAEFQVFTDEASYLQALASVTGQGGSSASSITDDGSQTASDPSESIVFTGPLVSFIATDLPFIGVSGLFQSLTEGGSILVSFAGDEGTSFQTFGPRTDSFEFFGFLDTSGTGADSVTFESADSSVDWVAEDITPTTSAVAPEPASCALFGMGALAMLGFGVGRRKDDEADSQD